MMPDAALVVTEKQYMRLIGACNRIAQIYVYPFSVPGLARSAGGASPHRGLLLRLRGPPGTSASTRSSSPARTSPTRPSTWSPSGRRSPRSSTWAAEHVTSILCSCLATHALVKHLHGIDRRPFEHKLWGVYRHRVRDRGHPLTQDINTRFDAPHSRWNDIPRGAWDAAGLHVLAESEDAGVHLATSPDGFRIVYFQGHPEYDRNSLLKEYKREVGRFLVGDLDAPPPYPEHYMTPEADDLAQTYLRDALAARAHGRADPSFPEEAMDPYLENTWGDTGSALFNNWLGLVYQLTGLDPHEPFMAGVDPADPLGVVG